MAPQLNPRHVMPKIILVITGLSLLATSLWGMVNWSIPPNFAEFSFVWLPQVNSVLGFLLSGTALLVFTAGRHREAKLLSAGVIVIGGLRLVEYLANTTLNIDPRIFSFTGQRSTTGPLCAINFILSGGMLSALIAPPIKTSRLLTISLLAMGVIAIGFLAMFGIASENQLIYQRLELAAGQMPTFAGFLLLGIGLLLATVAYSAKTFPLKRWLPVPVWFAVFITALFLWSALNAQEYRHAQATIGAAANNSKNHLLDFLNARVNTLKRFVLRWPNQEPALDEWQSSAALLAGDFPEFSEITWIDHDLTIRAVYPPSPQSIGAEEKNSSSSADVREALEQGQLTIKAINSNGVTTALLVYVPIHKRAELQGVVIGKLSLAPWLETTRDSEQGYKVTLVDSAPQFVTTSPNDFLTQHKSLQFYNLTQNIKLAPTSEKFKQNKFLIPDAALGAGFILATLLALLVHLFQTARAHDLETRDANRRLMREIVDRLRITQNLRASQGRLAGILRMAQEAIISVDDNQLILLFNTGAQDIFGYSSEEVVGKPLQLMLPEKFIADSLGTRRTQERQTEIVARRKNGEEFFAEASLSKLTSAEGIVYTTVLRDISDRKKASEALAESEARYKAMTANVPGVVFQLAQSPQGTLKFDYVSKGIEELLAVSVESIGTDANNLLKFLSEPHLSSFHRTRIQSAQSGVRWLWEGSIGLASGEQKWLSVKASMRPVERDELIWDGIILDETLRNSAQHELERSREQLRNLSVHLQAVREEEKKHIAREVHDELGGTLTALKMDIFWLLQKFSVDQQELWRKAKSMEGLVDAAVLATRRIVTELRPTILDDLGLVAALRWQAREFQARMNIRCVLETEAEDELEVEKNLALIFFRIFQETLTNVARHAQATQIDVKFYKREEIFFLEIADNGIGMDTLNVLNATSNGIRGIYERAHYASGKVTITSNVGLGTLVKVQIPQSAALEAQKRRALDL